MIRRVFLPRHVDTKGAVQLVAPQQLLWLWVLWVQLWWVLLALLWLQLLWPPGPDHRRWTPVKRPAPPTRMAPPRKATNSDSDSE